MLQLIDNNLIISAHDISIGGILVALSKMCLAGKVGAKINLPKSLINLNEYFFGEDQSRYIIEIKKKDLDKITNILNKNSVFFENIGFVQKENLAIEGEFDINIKELANLNNNWFKKYMD